MVSMIAVDIVVVVVVVVVVVFSDEHCADEKPVGEVSIQVQYM